MSSYQLWGWLLILVAVVTTVLLVRRYRQRRATTLHLIAGVIARAGFLFLGIIYVFGIVERNRRSPLLGLAVVGAGIALNLVAGIVENVRRAREPAQDEE